MPHWRERNTMVAEDPGCLSSLEAEIRDAVGSIRAVCDVRPSVGLVLGSGFAGLVRTIQRPVTLGYDEIPHFPSLGVPGHHGSLVLGNIGSAPVAVMSGRKHLYEGEGLLPVLFPVFVLRALGAEILVLTNAAGGAHEEWEIGDAMLIRDHIDSAWQQFTGEIPRVVTASGIAVPGEPPACPYSPRLGDLARDVAKEGCLVLREGVYVFSPGPFFETPAEVRALARLGGDAFGMSTAPEALLAVRIGMEVIAFSAISNFATGIADQAHAHEDVMANADRAVPTISSIIAGLLDPIGSGAIS
jgi:purine-nucleoside phosphorylase